MRRARPLAVGLALAAALAGCDEELDVGACGPDAEKRAVADALYDWYLYPELLPSPVERLVAPSRAAGAAELLAELTAEARARGMDRGWSYLTTATAAQDFFEEGKSVGVGIGLLWRGDRLYASQVYGGSAAEEAGFRRGDELLAVGEREDALVAVTRENLSELLGPSTAGVTRALRVRAAGAAEPETRTVTKRVFDLDPVRWRIIPREDGTRVGYLALRTFVRTAHPLLDEAAAAFRDAGIGDFVVDLRYNGGGLIATGELLANLLGGAVAPQSLMYRVAYNARHARWDGRAFFSPAPAAVRATRIAFVTTGASASASELVPNVLEPHVEVAMVGSKTYGKPVGQRPFQIGRCGTLAYLVSFRLENAQGDGAYFDGLPDAAGAFAAPLCAAADDLGREQWDAEEASTKAALGWLATGACPDAPGGVVTRPQVRAAPDAYPESAAPSLAQRHVQGLF